MANTISIVIQAKDQASAVLSSTASKITETSRALTTFTGGLEKIGTTATVGFTLPVVAMGTAALHMAGDFEKSLNILQSVTGATAKQMSNLREQARDLGNDISLPGVSASDAALAMTELAKAGLTVNNVMGASKGVLSLAKAGQIEVTEAAMTTARALNAYGLAGTEANRIADLLAAAANSSTASVQDMAYGLQMAGAQSHQMGVSLQDTITALSLFSNAGINGSDAGTSLKQMLLQLVTPSKDAAATMKNLGLKFFDVQGNFIGLSKMAEQLKDKTAKLTVEQKNAALAYIFGADATRVAAVMAQGGAAAFDQMSVSVNKTGAAMDLAAAQNKGFNGSLDNLKSTAETALIDIGTKLLPPATEGLKSMANAVSGVASWFSGLSPTSQRVIGEIVLLLAVSGPLMIGIAKVIEAVKVIGATFTAMKVLATASIIQTQISMAALQAMVATPMVMGGIAVAAALADIYLVLKAINTVKDALREMDAAKASAESAKKSQDQVHNELLNLQKNGDAGQKARATKLLGQGYALGTSFARGGLTPVGERGMELVDLPAGSKVYNAQDSQKMMSGAGKGVVINNLNVNNQMDIPRVIRSIGWRLQTA